MSSHDRIQEILAGIEATEAEPEGTDQDLIVKLHEMVERGMQAMSAAAAPAEAAPPAMTRGSLMDQTLERPLRPGEVSLDELERAFRETATEVAPAAPPKPPAPPPKPAVAAAQPKHKK